jgi:hypothetical protein
VKTAHRVAGRKGFEQKVTKETKGIRLGAGSERGNSTSFASLSSVALSGFDWSDWFD